MVQASRRFSHGHASHNPHVFALYSHMLSFFWLFVLSQQLNFYSFRKIKYADTIRIDRQLEAETANYWRFRHEKFQRGHPEWLADIKRMNSHKQQAKTQRQPSKAPSPAAAVTTDKDSNALKSEVTTLKQRIEDMTKNIDQLTSLVQKVTLAQKENEKPDSPAVEEKAAAEVGNKRKKMDESVVDIPELPPVPDLLVSNDQSMELDEDASLIPPSIPSPLPPAGERETSSSTELSDEGFVDQLFTVFKTEDFEFADSGPTRTTSRREQNNDNRPAPELMGKLSDALSLLPREIQEMIVNRLVDSITSPKQIQESISAAHCLEDVTSPVSRSPVLQSEEMEGANPPQSQSDVALPLAAATLAALLAQYGQQVPKSKQPQAHKTLPVIPVHA